MRAEYIIKENNDSLLVFCNGWGMDCHPFKQVGSKDLDVLVLYDYSSPDKVNIKDHVSRYSSAILMGWSMGVYYSKLYFKEDKELFERRIAINGTLCPVHDEKGIPVEVFKATMDNLSEESLLKFYKRMCRSQETYKLFLKNKPKRTILNQLEELKMIFEKTVCKDEDNSFFTDIIVTNKDMIVPTRNQLNFWDKRNIVELKGPHFPFYEIAKWDDWLSGILGYK